MTINWPDIIGQVIAWAIIAIIGLILGSLIKGFRKSKTWLGKNWMLILGSLVYAYVLYRIYALDKSYLVLATAYTLAIIMYIAYFYVRSIDVIPADKTAAIQNLEKKFNDLQKEQNDSFDNKIEDLTSKVVKLEVVSLNLEIEKWLAQDVLNNVINPSLEIIKIAPIHSYDYENALTGLEEVIKKIKAEKGKVDVYYSINIKSTLKKVPDDYSEIIHRILSTL